jgi:hypothetical protein
MSGEPYPQAFLRQGGLLLGWGRNHIINYQLSINLSILARQCLAQLAKIIAAMLEASILVEARTSRG